MGTRAAATTPAGGSWRRPGGSSSSGCRASTASAASAGEGSADVEGAEFLARALSKASRARAAEARPAAGFYFAVGRSTAGDGAFVERKREFEAAFTRAAATADWSGSLIARLPPIDAFGYDAGARLEREGGRRRAGRRPVPAGARRRHLQGRRDAARRRARSSGETRSVDAELRALGRRIRRLPRRVVVGQLSRRRNL